MAVNHNSQMADAVTNGWFCCLLELLLATGFIEISAVSVAKHPCKTQAIAKLYLKIKLWRGLRVPHLLCRRS